MGYPGDELDSLVPGALASPSGDGLNPSFGRTLQIDLYVSLAELSLALIGFAALVGAFRSSLDAQKPHEAIALRMLVEISLTAFLLSLLPVVLTGFISESTALWRTCSGVSAALVFAHISTGVFRSRRMSLPARFRMAAYPTVWLALGFVGLNLLNSCELLSVVSEGPFRGLVIVQLVCASWFFFVRFFLSEPDGSAA